MDHGHAFARGFQPDHEGTVGVVGLGHVAPGAEEEGRAALGAGCIAEGLDLLLRGEALVGVARRQHLARDLGVAVTTGKLADRFAVPVEPEPGQTVQDGLGRLGGGAFAVGILDAQKEGAAAATGI